MFSSKEPVLQPGCKILVTGASGFIGSHVVDQLLGAGYNVRGTTRDIAKNKWLAEFFEQKYGLERFELVTVPDLARDGAFDSALEGITSVVRSLCRYGTTTNHFAQVSREWFTPPQI
jgi:nucleoside-diphosphate-sugar epimerase